MKTTHANSYNVDWMTVTAGGQKRGAALITQAVQTGMGANGQLPIQTPWFFQGYRGWNGEGLRYGTNNKGDAIVQMSGDHAARHWKALKGYWDQCSRLDLAVTVFLPEIDKNVALRAYNGLSEQNKVKTTYIQNNRGGATFYCGSRPSRRYARVYDKGAEQGKQPGLVWRYEVEYKKPLSRMLLETLEAAGSPENIIGMEVREHFARFDIIIPGAPTIPHNAIEAGRNLTNDEKKLQWLHRQVLPAVRQLIDSGLKAEVYQALGLSPLSMDDYMNQFKENDEWP